VLSAFIKLLRPFRSTFAAQIALLVKFAIALLKMQTDVRVPVKEIKSEM
jgi:hypothetical protein